MYHQIISQGFVWRIAHYGVCGGGVVHRGSCISRHSRHHDAKGSTFNATKKVKLTWRTPTRRNRACTIFLSLGIPFFINSSQALQSRNEGILAGGGHLRRRRRAASERRAWIAAWLG